jgi:hypothetical protein
MGKVIESPVKLFPGTVEIHDQLDYPKFIEYENSVATMSEATADHKAGKITQGETDVIVWKELFKMVINWNIQGFDRENIPATPRIQVIQVMGWLTREIGKVVNGEPDSKK